MAHDKPATGIIFAALLGSLGTTLLLRFANSLADLAMLPALGGLGHFVVIKAFQVAPASVIAPLGYVGLSGLPDLRQLPRRIDLGRGAHHHRLGPRHCDA